MANQCISLAILCMHSLLVYSLLLYFCYFICPSLIVVYIFTIIFIHVFNCRRIFHQLKFTSSFFIPFPNSLAQILCCFNLPLICLCKYTLRSTKVHITSLIFWPLLHLNRHLHSSFLIYSISLRRYSRGRESLILCLAAGHMCLFHSRQLHLHINVLT